MQCSRVALVATATVVAFAILHVNTADAIGKLTVGLDGQPNVRTALGLIRGVICNDSSSATKIASFLRIPFALPPVGKLRFAAPRKWTSKYPAAGLSATRPAPMCMQLGEGEMSEDCLFLNVWAPVNITQPLPVRVFIHGGGYQSGSGADRQYDSCAVARDGSTLVVTLNYRLGVLGFLARPGLADPTAGGTTGNWGLLDQRMALKWIRSNIAAFGGDPNRVLLSGESAGAYSTLLHMVSPGSAGLFQTAVSFSGSSDVMAIDFAGDAYYKGETIKQIVYCSGSFVTKRGFRTAKDCLRATPAFKLLEAQAALGQETVLNCIPFIDGVVIPKHPNTLMKEGRANNVASVINVNAREGIIEAFSGARGSFSINQTEFLRVVNGLVPVPRALEPWLLAQYNASQWGDSWFFSAVNAVTDGGYHCPSLRAAKLFAAQGLSTRMSVLQAAQPNTGCALLTAYGMYISQEFVNFADAFHAYDVPLSFLAPYRSPYNGCNWTNTEKQLASFLSGMVNSLAARGNPLPPSSASFTASLPGGLTWPEFTGSSQEFLNINISNPITLDTNAWLAPKCIFWDAVLEHDIAAQTIFSNYQPPSLPPLSKPPTSRRRPPPPRRTGRLLMN